LNLHHAQEGGEFGSNLRLIKRTWPWLKLTKSTLLFGDSSFKSEPLWRLLANKNALNSTASTCLMLSQHVTLQYSCLYCAAICTICTRCEIAQICQSFHARSKLRVKINTPLKVGFAGDDMPPNLGSNVGRIVSACTRLELLPARVPELSLARCQAITETDAGFAPTARCAAIHTPRAGLVPLVRCAANQTERMAVMRLPELVVVV